MNPATFRLLKPGVLILPMALAVTALAEPVTDLDDVLCTVVCPLPTLDDLPAQTVPTARPVLETHTTDSRGYADLLKPLEVTVRQVVTPIQSIMAR